MIDDQINCFPSKQDISRPVNKNFLSIKYFSDVLKLAQKDSNKKILSEIISKNFVQNRGFFFNFFVVDGIFVYLLKEF